MTEKTFREWAKYYATEWGVCVIPLREGKQPAVRWSEYQRRMPTKEELDQWFGGDDPAWGMALVCGGVSGNLVRLDFDDPGEFHAMYQDDDMPSDVLEGLAFKSQRKGGGYGMVFKNEWNVRKAPGGSFPKYPKLELMGEGCITVVPPTPGYEWLGKIGIPPTLDLPRVFLGHDLWRVTDDAKGMPLNDELNDLLENTTKGGRDNALTRLVNALRARNLGLPIIKNIVVPHAVDWDHGDDPWDAEKIEGMVEKKYGQYAHEGARYGGAEQEMFEDTEMDLSAPKLSEAAKSFVVDRLVMGGDMSNVALAAFTGTGKTTLMLEAAVCMARGIPLWGALDVPRAMKVVFIDQEQVSDQIAETMNMIAEVYGRPGKGMLTLLSGKEEAYSITRPESLERLERRLDSMRPDFVFLDGWQWFVNNRVSDREIVGPALAWWKRIRAKYDCGTWIVHHTKKMGAPQFRPANMLEMSSGAQTLMDQARTKLVYEHLSGDYGDYGYLQGKCGRAEWNPVRMVLEYDSSTQSHRFIDREEAAELFDAEQVEAIWGKRAETRKLIGLLNRLKRHGFNSLKLADYLGVSRSAVAKWRTGQNRPSAEKAALLEALHSEALKTDTKEGAPVTLPVNIQSTLAPVKQENMPNPIYKYIECNKEHDTCPVPAVAEGESSSTPKDKHGYAGKPGPLCGKCPLKDQPYVGGRDGVEGCVMLIGDGPGQSDAKKGRAYSGRSGLRLEKGLKLAKMSPKLCRFTNVVACHVKKSRIPTKKALQCCRLLLEKELAEFKPKMVITLGNIAFKAFYPGRLRDYHGLRIAGEGYEIVPMYKPDAGEKSPELGAAFVEDFHALKGRPKMRRLEGDYRRAEDFNPANELVAVDTETTGLALTSEIVGVGICDTPGEAVFMTKENGIASLTRHTPERALFYNAKFDLGILESNGLVLPPSVDVEDAMLLAYVMEKKPLGLKGMVLQQLNLEMRFFKDVLGNKTTFADVPEEEAVRYGAGDPDATLRLWEHLWKKADSRERTLYRDVEKPLPALLAKMQLNGVLVDVPYLERLGDKMRIEIAKVLRRMEKLGVAEDVVDSPLKLSQYLYGELKLPVPYTTETGTPSTEHDALERLVGRHEFVGMLLEYRHLSKLKSTFVDGVLEKQVNGLIFPQFNQVGTVTGRMSSSDPNMQNLPKKEDLTVRKAYIAPEGFVVASFDNSQIDLRVLAHESKDPIMCQIFDKDMDVHSETARQIYGTVDKAKRRTAKTANFLIVFGGGPSALATKAGIPEADAAAYLDSYWAKYSGVHDWIKRLHSDALENGYVETMYGRRRTIPKLFTGKRSAALREAQNAPIQGGSSDILKLQMAAVAGVVTPFAQIHDELLFYLPKERLDETVKIIKAAMENVECPFKLKVNAAVGPSLGELREVEL